MTSACISIAPATTRFRRSPTSCSKSSAPAKFRRKGITSKNGAVYHAIGIREYVIVDRFAKSVVVLTREPDGYRERILKQEDVYSTPLLPGFELALRDLF